jgi:putative photosynthetic complex assembly protein 2
MMPMAEIGLAALFTLFLWWASTGLIIYLDGLRRETFGWTMLGASVLLLLALFGLHALSPEAGVTGAWLGFLCGTLCWGWIEIAFLTGAVTGPRRTACPPALRGFARLRAATEVVLWHELAILALALVMLAITWGAPNQIGTWTFLAFWVMRLSAKFNLFLGVRNRSEAFLPDHLRYLDSYFPRARMNLLFPFSVLAGVVATALLLLAAIGAEATRHESVGFTLLATLVALGLLEHIFMVLPVPADGLWRWGLASRRQPAKARAGARTEGRPRPSTAA